MQFDVKSLDPSNRIRITITGWKHYSRRPRYGELGLKCCVYILDRVLRHVDFQVTKKGELSGR